MTYHWDKDRIEFLFTMLGEAFEKGFVTHKYGLPPAKVLRIMLITFNQKYPSEEELTVQKLRNKFSLLSNAYKRYEDSFNAAGVPENKWMDPESWTKLQTSPHRFPKFRVDDYWWFFLMHQSMRGKVTLENGERIDLNWMIDPYVNHSPEPSTPTARDDSIPNSYGESPIKFSRDSGSGDLNSEGHIEHPILSNPSKIPKLSYDSNPFMRLKHDPSNQIRLNQSLTPIAPAPVQLKPMNRYNKSTSGPAIDNLTEPHNYESSDKHGSNMYYSSNHLSPNRDYEAYPGGAHGKDPISISNSSVSGENSPTRLSSLHHGEYKAPHSHRPTHLSSDTYNNDYPTAATHHRSKSSTKPSIVASTDQFETILDKIASNLTQMTTVLSKVGGVGNHTGIIEENYVNDAMKVIQGMGLNPMSFLKAFNILKDPINAKAFCALETKNRIVYLQASGVLSDNQNNFDGVKR
ncbi:hypothetical protein CONCODRAFT_76982 [Conidiobolus coronatus NRRL 28638]|uniref:Myb/SANT-like domain-containing protein n=1 Tax=Conidiobolus coronatus (strain ATCC 28846 / CBS 209.66 / NRRL 28638) TaxID=796925 RepID=A0A137PGJ7_CONC2|nr:hypothetical protein CONCODRAFT_76982 [Conidiobolus coronatus NRRL 28638]|eukprot:KXN74108.1 hypothetical protein CONCODRAFT_76982 [Conidiobolus coronatus NRRL 28638]